MVVGKEVETKLAKFIDRNNQHSLVVTKELVHLPSCDGSAEISSKFEAVLESYRKLELGLRNTLPLTILYWSDGGVGECLAR